jgi:hypothetical protein
VSTLSRTMGRENIVSTTLWLRLLGLQCTISAERYKLSSLLPIHLNIRTVISFLSATKSTSISTILESPTHASVTVTIVSIFQFFKQYSHPGALQSPVFSLLFQSSVSNSVRLSNQSPAIIVQATVLQLVVHQSHPVQSQSIPPSRSRSVYYIFDSPLTALSIRVQFVKPILLSWGTSLCGI